MNNESINILALGRDVAGHLPGEWRVNEAESTKYHNPALLVVIADDAGREFIIDRRVGLASKKQFHVHGRFPHRPGMSDYGLRDARPSINVGASKTAERIAKDIARRFLPDFLSSWARWAARVADFDASEDQEARNRQELADAYGGKVVDNGSGPHIWAASGVDFTYVSETSVNITLRIPVGAALDIAPAVLKAIAAHKEE